MRKLIAIAAAALLAGGIACAADRKATPPRADGGGKAQAPVAIEAALSHGAAELTLTFQADASEVEVKVYGLDGLQVTSAAPPVVDGSFAKGETRRIEVSYAAPAGQSNLAVSVRGVFAGVRSGKTATFSVGQASGAEKARGVVTDVSGERVRELPAETR